MPAEMAAEYLVLAQCDNHGACQVPSHWSPPLGDCGPVGILGLCGPMLDLAVRSTQAPDAVSQTGPGPGITRLDERAPSTAAADPLQSTRQALRSRPTRNGV
ncbi:hypothetical protein AAFF_G00337400 [Aldrovandia affinis]|uniref:Uncharacterized protein n=1 Tax=Aldrovandia affinis TaxID=143900 RepID=A0AAD7WPQ9_9TELE|nr:hypothetical protein AAFF_G00337400 [Aldrovandia affinis]